MLLSLLLLPLASFAQAPVGDSLLSALPADAYALVHCRDAGALRARVERNDWYRLLGSSQGEPLLNELRRAFQDLTHSDLDDLLPMTLALDGEVVFFDTGTVAGLVAEPTANREALAGLMRDWLPRGDAAARRAFEHAGGAVELVAWPAEIDGWSGRAGHFAASVDHPQLLAIYSGDDSASVLTALTDGLRGLGLERSAPLVTSYLASGGGKGNGIEVFVDFTPFVEQAEAALKEAVENVLPDPSNLLGLEGGTWLYASADVFPGTRVDCRARLYLPPDTLAARLADTFKPLPHTLPADLPKGIWGLYALNWDLKLFYQRARAAYEEAGLAEGLAFVDFGLETARGMADVDPIEDVLNQLVGDVALYIVEPANRVEADDIGETEQLLSLGIHAGLVDGNEFLAAFEKLIDVGDLESVLAIQEIAGVSAYVMDEDDGFDGGLAILPQAFTAALSRRVLERGLQALTRVTGASLLDGSRMRAAMDENAGACFLTCLEMTPLRAFLQSEGGSDFRLPALEDGQPARDPFDSQLISTVRRTEDGFELRIHTR